VAERAWAFDEGLGELDKDGHGDDGEKGEEKALRAKGKPRGMKELGPKEVVEQVVKGDGSTWCDGGRARG
jgi:hypothetical protein